MADFTNKDAQYAYVQMSNQVIDGDRKHVISDPSYSGAAMSLRGTQIPKMGSRVDGQRSEDLSSLIEKRKKVHWTDEEIHSKKRKTHTNADDLFNDLDNLNIYRPTTPVTRNVYKNLMSFIREKLGDQPEDVLMDAANELLIVLKDDEVPEKKAGVEAILEAVTDEEVNDLLKLAQQITDFSKQNEVNGDDTEEHILNINPEDNEDEEQFNTAVISDESSSEEEDEGMDNENYMEHSEKASKDHLALTINDIGANWLEERLSEFMTDSNMIRSTKAHIMDALQYSDINECENMLMEIIGDNSDLMTQIMENKAVIYYGIRYKECKTEEERKAIEEQMEKDIDNNGPALLLQLTSENKIDNWKPTDYIQREQSNIDKKRKTPDSRSKIEGEEGAFHALASESSIPTPDTEIDLRALEFVNGNHQMTRVNSALPEGTQKEQRSGYEEVIVPALKKQARNDHLIPIKSLPEWAQPAFNGMDHLNPVQSKVCETALYSSENILLCAPTGAGKTNVAILTIMHEIGLHLREDGSVDKSKFKIVYIAPMKALVKEVVEHFSQRLESYGIVVHELSGDINMTKEEISETQIIVTTPEKWDIITRKSGDRTYTQLVRLIIIDEIHLLHDERGPVIESIVARTQRQIESTQEMVRLVGLSATLPNYKDVALFLRVEKGLFFFDNSYRPIPLEQHFIGITEKKAHKALQLMNQICYDKVLDEVRVQNQVIIFVHSRKETVKTAQALRNLATENDTIDHFIQNDARYKELLTSVSQQVKNAELKDLLPFGFAVHHAGLSREDRTLIEDLFADRKIPVLVSTMTLAWGVNLPAHTVIIKGTQMYSPEKGKWVELSPQDILQMLGRAGRPQYDSSGTGMIITKYSELQYYVSLMNLQLPIESQFIRKLEDNMNAEIVMGTIQNISDAVNWLGYTYLFVRMCHSPSLYGIDADTIQRDPYLLQRRVDLVHSAAVQLAKNGLIRYERKTGSFQSTSLGRTAAYYYITNSSIAVYNANLSSTLSEIDIFRLFSLSNEFSQIIVRQEEKGELEKLIQHVPIPIHENADEPIAKVNVLLQAYISRQKLEGFALASDLVFIQQSASRIFRALFEICIKKGWSAVSQRILTICKCVEKQMWSSQSPLRQFGNALPEEIYKKLENNPLTFDRYYDLKPENFNEMINITKDSSVKGSKAKNANTIYKLVHKIPRLDVQVTTQTLTRSILRIELVITADFNFDENYHHKGEGFHILVEDSNGEKLLHYEFFVLKKKYCDNEAILSFTVPLFEPMSPVYFLRIINDRWLHAETYHSILLDHILLPEKFYPSYQIKDMKPLTLEALHNEEYKELYASQIQELNSLQTNVFDTLYNTDMSTLICAPVGSGKTFMAELSILRHLNNEDPHKILYIAANEEEAAIRYQDWKKFEALGLSVTQLIGDLYYDREHLARHQLIISTPETWDYISRKWKQRKSLQSFSLVIVDDIHLLDSSKGAILEAGLTRILYMRSTLQLTIRIVALGASIGNANTIAKWLGCEKALFNFHTGTRPLSLETYMEGFDSNNIGIRLSSMAKPVYNTILRQAGNKPVIVFVPSKKQAQITCIDLMTFAKGSNNEDRFVSGSKEELEAAMAKMTEEDDVLKTVMAHGVGFYYKGMNKRNESILLEAYNRGLLQVLVATHDTCWSLQAKCYLVIIMETSYYQGTQHGYVDYTINEMLQMMGHANRPGIDYKEKCAIFYHSPKKEYYTKFLNEPLCVESQLQQNLADIFNSEVSNHTISSYQDSLDYLTYTYYILRLQKNALYYGLSATDQEKCSEYLSDIVEETFNNLVEYELVEVDENTQQVSASNLSSIADHFYVHYDTIYLFNTSLKEKLKKSGLVEILSSATEFYSIPIRNHEMDRIRQEIEYLPYAITSDVMTAKKTNYLLQNYFDRRPLSSDSMMDLKTILPVALRLLHALIEVGITRRYLQTVINAIELCQMIVQGTWNQSSRLKQLPYFDDERIELCEQKGMTEVFDIIECEDEQREEVFVGLNDKQQQKIAEFCNTYPNIDIEYEIENEKSIVTDDVVNVNVTLTRDLDEDCDPTTIGMVNSQSYPIPKKEVWWLFVGNEEKNELLRCSTINLGRQNSLTIPFEAPSEPGHYQYKLYFMNDSYLGCDQDMTIEFDVRQGDEEMNE